MNRAATVAGAGALFLSALALQHCSTPPATQPASSAAASLTPVLSVKEVMEHIVDPIADWVFDAAVIDVTAKGVVETLPLSDEDWLKVERGGAESQPLSYLTPSPPAPSAAPPSPACHVRST